MYRREKKRRNDKNSTQTKQQSGTETNLEWLVCFNRPNDKTITAKTQINSNTHPHSQTRKRKEKKI